MFSLFPAPPPLDGLAELKALGTIIQDSISKIEAAVTAEKLPFPSSSTPYTPDSEAAHRLPAVAEATSYLVAAAYQIIHVARSPSATILVTAVQFSLSACMGIAARANVAEACREAGPQGARVKDIATVTDIDPSKLARVLRVLATNHIFEEVAPDVFRNNRISSLFDSGKSVQALIKNPNEKHVGATGIAAYIGHCTDEAMKAGAYLEDALFDPKLGKSEASNDTPLNLAFNTKMPFFEWVEAKENQSRLLRFGIAMEGSQKTAPPDLILQGFNWASLSRDALIVDVGGGVGAQSLTLARAHSHLRFVIQDRPLVMKEAKSFWEAQAPGILTSGRISFEAHDFFTPQPVSNASVFMMRMILHDWSDKLCIQILRHLRDAASPSTQLLIIDNVVTYACAETSLESIPGLLHMTPLPPLLANLGYANTAAYYTDIQMMGLLNSKERTVSQVRELLKKTGWELVQVHQIGPFNLHVQKMVGVPV